MPHCPTLNALESGMQCLHYIQVHLLIWMKLKNIISLTVRFPLIKLSAISRCKQFTWTDMWYIWLYLYGTKTTKLFIPMTTSTVLCQPKVFQSCRQRNSKHCKIGHAQSRVKIYLKVKSKYCIMHIGCIDTWYIWHLGKIRQLNSPTAVPHETINLYREKFIEQFVPITTRHSHLNPVPLIKGKRS